MWGIGKRKIFLILGTLILVAALIAGLIVVRNRTETRVGAAGVTLSLNTPTTTVTKNNNFTVDVFIDTKGYSVTGADLKIKYNPQLIQFVSITQGNFLPVLFVPGAASGDIASIVMGSDPSQPKTGTGILAKVTFKAINSGTANMTFGTGTAISALNQASNIADVMTGVNVTVTGATTPPGASSPTPTAPSGGCQPPAGGGVKTGDVNRDNCVNIIDIGIIIDNYRIQPIPDPRADVNNSGVVDIVDIGVVIDHYGS